MVCGGVEDETLGIQGSHFGMGLLTHSCCDLEIGSRFHISRPESLEWIRCCLFSGTSS